MEELEIQRKSDRRNYGAHVSFSFMNNSFSGWVKDISRGGAFIETYSVNQFNPGDIVTVRIPFTNGKKEIRCKARILRLNEEGFAVEFLL